LPVTAAALQKECEKLLGGRWSGHNSNTTRSGRFRRHTTVIPNLDGDACLAEWLSDSGAVGVSSVLVEKIFKKIFFENLYIFRPLQHPLQTK